MAQLYFSLCISAFLKNTMLFFHKITIPILFVVSTTLDPFLISDPILVVLHILYSFLPYLKWG